MKKSNLFRLMMCGASLTLMVACSESRDNVRNDQGASTSNIDNTVTEPDVANDDMSAEWRSERDNYRMEANRRIERNQAELTRLRGELKEEKAEARREYEEKIADLEQRNERMKARLNDDRDDTRDGWNNFRSEFDRDMEELGNSISNVFRKDKTGNPNNRHHD